MKSFAILPDAAFEEQIDCLFSNYAERYSLSEMAAPMLNNELFFSMGDQFRIGNQVFYKGQQTSVEFYLNHPLAQLVESKGEHFTFGVIFKPWALTLMERCGTQDLRRVPIPVKIKIVKSLFINEFGQEDNQPMPEYLHNIFRFIANKITFRAPGDTIKAILEELEGVRTLGKPINSIIDRAGISHKSVIASFRNHIGVTPLRFVHHHAVLKTLPDLQAGIIPIAQIAVDNGFYDQSHFNRVFKSFMLISPGIYRQSYFEGKFRPIKA